MGVRGLVTGLVKGLALSLFSIPIYSIIITNPITGVLQPNQADTLQNTLNGAIRNTFTGKAGITSGFNQGHDRGNEFINNRVRDKEKEETIKAIKDSFKPSIEIITEKVMNKYKEEKYTNYQLIKGNE